MNTLKFRSGSLPLGRRTYVMGIVNVTPDSFSDGGEYLAPEKAIDHALLLENEGVDILDIGGQSTRPGHIEITPQEEWSRLEPVLRGLRGRSKLPVSVDTYFPYVAERALALGADIINDVSGVLSPDMAEVVKKSAAAWVIMHAQTLDETDSGAETVARWLRAAAARAENLGVDKECICLDPGIGFGKNNAQNYNIIRETAAIKPEGCAYLIGASRKRCIGAADGNAKAAERDFGTAAAHTIAVMGGAEIVRAHCGAGAVFAARVADAIRFGEIR